MADPRERKTSPHALFTRAEVAEAVAHATINYDEMTKGFLAWLDSRPAGYNGDGVANPGGRWFDAFVAGVRWQQSGGRGD